MDTDILHKILQDAGLNLPRLAKLSGLSVETLRSLSIGRRKPRAATLAKLADGMDRHADDLRALASRLRSS